MIINENGVTTLTKPEIITEIENELKRIYGNHFSIKDNGIIDTIVKIYTDIEYELQENLAQIANYYNPNMVSGIWQDELYERIGINRIPAQKTTFTLGIISDEVVTINSGALRIRSGNNKKEFTNSSEIKTSLSGLTLVDFIADEYGEIEISPNDTFDIINAPYSILSIDNGNINNIHLGREKESFEDYKKRYTNLKAVNSKGTHYANIANLYPYVDNDNYLKILDKKFNSNLDPMTVYIIAKHNTTNEQFAKAILETFGAGILYSGNTEVTVKDLTNNNVKVKFQNATAVDISIYIEVSYENERLYLKA